MYDHDQLPSTPCVECPTGRFQSQTGTTECSLCAAGLYQTTVKAFECAKCPAGKTTNVSRTFEQVPSTILYYILFGPRSVRRALLAPRVKSRVTLSRW